MENLEELYHFLPRHIRKLAQDKAALLNRRAAKEGNLSGQFCQPLGDCWDGSKL